MIGSGRAVDLRPGQVRAPSEKYTVQSISEDPHLCRGKNQLCTVILGDVTRLNEEADPGNGRDNVSHMGAYTLIVLGNRNKESKLHALHKRKSVFFHS